MACPKRPTVLLDDRDILNAWNNDVEGLVDAVQLGFQAYADGEVIFPEKSSLIFNEETQDRINCMPAAIRSLHRSGVKWVSVFPDNPSRFGLPNVGGAMILSEMESGQPVCVMSAAALTALRTAAVDALAARYLAPRASAVLSLIGTGEQAHYHAKLIACAGSNMVVHVSGRNSNHTHRLTERLQGEGVEAIDFGTDMRGAVSSSDIVVTAISGQAPVLKADWIVGGGLYCHVGGWEDEYAVPKKADAIVCDNWEALKHRGSPTIARMYERGMLKDEDIYASLPEIITGQKTGRTSESQFIYFNAIGLSYIDVAVASWLFDRAVEKSLGSFFFF